ncbi:polyphosphate kinase 2 [Cecembia rubra]|uniref:Polyphosphate kinase 2 n=1 Tax=Cecembia rubra TaxID=1485585 RepID=A0A2P8E212_9BACT|nr:polyphosphate kinase 2 [Cecembia rubra]PSL03495.1 polyphosphate kinase 2 [Cecembia rubra]
MELSKEDLKILNSNIGLKHLLAHKKINLEKALSGAKYELALREIQAELVKMQLWIIANQKKVMVLFHGGDSSEKSGVIRKILSHNNPRHYRVEVNLPHQESSNNGEWYFKKFVEKLPQGGEMVFWDRSWYNRAIIEPVHGLCTQEEYDQFMGQVNDFERMLHESGIQLIKFYLNISMKEQTKRLEDVKSSPLTKWKMTPFDEQSKELWADYKSYKEKMIAHTHTELTPWIEINKEKREEEMIEAARQLLQLIPYDKG